MKRFLIVLAILLTASPAMAGEWASGPWATNWNGGDARYLNESDNLSDVDSAATAFDFIKQAATTSYTGVVELATDAEAQALVSTSVVLAPSNLAAVTSTEARPGIIELATAAEVVTGTDAVRAVTPAGGSGAYLDEASNLSDVDSAATARTNLGLGTAAVEDATTFAQVANNGTDYTAGTFLTNMGFSAFVKTTISAADAAAFYTLVVQGASTTDAGAVRLSTDPEALGLTRTNTAVTPSNLGAMTSTTTQKGINTNTTTSDAGDATNTENLTPAAAYAAALGTKWVILDAVPAETVNSTHEKDECYVVWPESGTWNLVAIEAHSLTAATAGTLTVNLYNATDSQNLLSTAITIDVNETDSATAAAPRVIDTAHDDVTAGDVLFPVISVAGDGYGCQIRAGFQKQ